MKQRKLNTLISLICLLAVLVAVFAAWGCTTSTPTTTAPTTTAPTTTAPTTTAPMTTAPTTTAPPTSPVSTKPIKIGALLSLTGPFAMWGEGFSNGMKLALEQVNNKIAGRPVELLIEDEGDPDTTIALQKAKKLVEQDKVDLLFDPFFTPANPPVLKYTSSVPIVTIGYNESLSGPEENDNPYAFFVALSYYDTTYPLGLYAYDELGFRTVTTLTSDFSCGYEFIGGFADAFKLRGGQVIQQLWAPLDEVDYSPYISQLDTSADALVLATLGPPAGMAALTALGERGLWDVNKWPILISEPGTYPAQVRESMGDKLEGLIGVDSYLTSIDTPENKKFVGDYQTKYGVVPDDKIASAYNAMLVAIAGLEASKGDSTPNVLRAAIKSLKINIPSGPLSFSPGRHGIQSLNISQLQKKNGVLNWELIKTYSNLTPHIQEFPD